MTDQIASITLRADVSDLKTASNELDKLGQAAAGAVDKADDLNSVFRAGADAGKQSAAALWEQQKSFKGLLESIDPTLAALGKLDDQQQKLRSIHSKGLLDTEEFTHYQKILDDTRLKLTDTGEAAARAQAELAATQAAEKQSAALKNLLGSIDPTIRAFNSLDEQHAQLVAHFEAGRINGAQFEHFNTILNQTRERLSGVADVLPEALSRQEAAARRAGISVGQYSAAMRTLPAQFTDIATQLAGGQSPFLILLQQGGQIKDQFGSVQGALSGVGEYIRSMAGMINPTTIALGGLIGTIGLLAAAAYNSSEQFEQVARSVIMMGGAGFSSMQQLNQAAEEVAGKTNTSISSTVDTLVTLNDTGKYTASQMKQVATTITLMGKAGNDTKAAMADFGKIVSDPVKGLATLNEQYGFVDEAMIKHIIQLRKQKGEQAAVTEAIELFAGVMEKRAQETIEATDNIGKAWSGLKAFASDTFGQIGVTVRAWGNQVIEVFKLLGTSFEALFVKMKEFSLEVMGGMITGFTDIANKLPGGESLIKSMGFDGLAESVAKNREAASKEYAQLTADYNKHIANLSKSQGQWEEEAKNGAGGGVRGSGAVSRESRDAVSKLAEDSAKKAKEAKATLDAGDRTLENYRAQARTLTETLETLRKTGETQVRNTEFSKQQSRFAELDEAAKTRALTAQEKSLLSSREAILNAAKMVDQKNKEVEAQQKINGLAQQANKYVTQMSEKTEALRGSAGLSSRQSQRMMEEAQLRQGWLNGGGKLEDSGYQKELAALRNYYAEEDKLRGDWKTGAVAGWNEYLDAATNTYDAVKNVASSTLTGLSNMLTDLMTTGTASVKEFGKSMLKMILEVTNRLMVAYAVQAAMGWISGGSGASAGAGQSFAVPSFTPNAKGGVYDSPGLSKYVNGVYDSPQYFTFQGASKFAKGGVFAEAGAEAIMPLTRDSAGRLGVRAQGGGGMAPVINTTVNVDAGGSVTTQTSSSGDAMGRALAEEMQNAALQVVQKQLKPGGMIYNFSKGR
ncbi:TPA: phage tail tape measure protein [Salmonella enterica]|nr:phage tail tape measure protein [Salmonella enterica subsp. enterica serovar Luckenwalde]HAU6778366.1 phage tail tape measure protein [Salmonella enterica subsp. enterica serovar Luckenwalde]HCL4954857.1 phage tail tape measure protein [Salmonella enterica]